MMKLEFQNNPKGFYYSGEKIECALLVNVSSPCIAKYIEVTFSGYADVVIRSGEDGDQTEREHFFRNTVRLTHSERKQNHRMTTGDHWYKLVFQLPRGLPPSFYIFGNRIKYFVKAKLVHSRKSHKAEKVEKCFDVRNDVAELQTLVPSRPPTSCVHQQQKGIFCHSNGTISASVSLEKACFVHGEVVNIRIDFNNESTKTVHHSEVRLVKRIICPTKKGKPEILARLRGGKIKSGESVSFTQLTLQIPHGEFSISSHLCKKLNVNYTVQLVVTLFGWASCFVVPVEILIGTTPDIPLEEGELAEATTYDSIPPAYDSMPPAYDSMPPAYDSMPPAYDNAAPAQSNYL